jgi:uncharacterized membrane protein (DUF485 family)
MSNTYTIDVKKVDDVLIAEKNRLDKKKELIDKAEFSQNRQQELNESYRKRYMYYNYIGVVVVIMLLIYLVLVTLQYLFPIIPSVIVDIASILIFAFIIIFVGYNLVTIYSRDKLNFDKINNDNANIISPSELAKQRKTSIASGDLSTAASIDIGSKCIGEACCSIGTRWDSGNSVCTTGNVISAFTSISESFSMIDQNAIVINGTVRPFEPSEFDNYAKI